MATNETDLATIDTALIRLRRLWTTPQRTSELQRNVGSGVMMSQVLVVDAVARAHEGVVETDGGEVTVGSVAEQLSVNESTASRLVDATVRAGMVARHRSVDDSRRTLLTLTTAGEQLFDRAAQFRRSYLEGLLEDWDPADRATFARLLGRFADDVNA